MNGKVNSYQIKRLHELEAECTEHIQGLPRGSPGADLSGTDWLISAITVAALNANDPGLPYVEAVLANWREDKYQAPKGGKKDGDRRRYIKGEFADVVQH